MEKNQGNCTKSCLEKISSINVFSLMLTFLPELSLKCLRKHFKTPILVVPAVSWKFGNFVFLRTWGCMNLDDRQNDVILLCLLQMKRD